MADETVFDFLHSEVVNYVCNRSDTIEDKKVLEFVINLRINDINILFSG